MKTKIIVFAFAVLALLILFLPIPQKIEKSYEGTETDSGKTVTINLTMTYLRFLALPDRLFGEIQVVSDVETFTYGEHLHYVGRPPDDEMHNLSGWYFNETTYLKDYGNGNLGTNVVGFEPLIVYVSKDFNRILIIHNNNGVSEGNPDRQYVGFCGGNAQEAKQYFSGYYQ